MADPAVNAPTATEVIPAGHDALPAEDEFAQDQPSTPARLPGLSLAALGVVFGDIGTSPVYTFRECFNSEHGLPLDADMVLDIRFLPNPYWIDDLRPLPGTDKKIRDYVMSQAETADFMKRLDTMLDGLVPGFLHEGKRYLTIAVGCTGGRHRSVVVAEAIAESLRRRSLNVAVRHRDLERE